MSENDHAIFMCAVEALYDLLPEVAKWFLLKAHKAFGRLATA